LRGKAGPQTDVFSLGCTMFEICEARRAYSGRSKPSVPAMKSKYRAATKELITACMSYNAAERPPVSEISERIRDIRFGVAAGKIVKGVAMAAFFLATAVAK
jgi:hypothetical protein